MPSECLLRLLIIADLLLIILGVVISFLSESSLPEPLRAYEQAQPEADLTTKDWVLVDLCIPLIIAWLVSSIGLLVFWAPARPLYLFTTIAAILITPFFGPYVEAGWTQAHYDTSSVISGVVLALVYWSPLRNLYDSSENAV